MKITFQILLWAGICAGIGSGISSCRPDALDGLSPEESQVFITNRDRSVNFATYKTFSLPDSVLEISNDQAQISMTGLEPTFLNRLAQELTSRGYQRVNRRADSDLGVAVMRINNSYVGVSSMPYSSYYLDYWGYGGLGGWGGYRPYYPSYYSFYQVSDTYWMIQLIDLKNPNTADQELNVIWQAQIRGSGIFDANSIDAIITRVFEQSSYLRANQ
ncbi:uncharacterized protein DUF4136 [Larkinella arboricola]|uniref:Uncharacterized protein DUF4136 n=1 Tax=Larkinella arboricola TaxID=643671 RepID=A0A327XBG5_LARAB|nr:DUF4136 domain-containing protein [Larkinella arboricola]RAK03223.1 uncharacterized protein DUF4136 [Larkinella arboricola]